MRDQDKTKAQLISELEELRGRVATPEGIDTNRRQAEEDLRSEHQRAQQYLDVAGVIMVVLDNSGNIRLLNRKGYAVLGYDNGDLLGKNWFDTCVPQRIRDEVKSVFRELIAGKVASAEYYDNPVVAKSGEERIVAWHNAVLTDDTGAIVGTLSSGLDITERKRADDELREGKRRLSTLMSNLPGMAYRCRNDPQWTMEFISDGCVLLTGYTPLAFTGNHEVAYGDIIHPDDRERVWQEVQQAIAEDRHFQLEYRIHTASGEEKWVWEQGIAIYADSGEVEALEGLMTDITDRRQAEEELAKNWAMLQATIECLPFDFFAIGEDGHYLMENAVCRAHWGRLVGKAPEDMAPNEGVRALWLENNRRAFAGERVESEARVTIRNEERFVYQVIAPIRDEAHSYGILGVNVDITDRRRAEEALKKAHDELERRVEERTAELSTANERLRIFQMFMEASGQGFGMADLDGCITYWNPTLCRLFGEDRPENVVGKHVSAYYPKEYWEKRQNKILPAVMRDGHWQGELVVYSRQGKATPILQNTFLIRDENGTPLRLAAAITDITELKRAEEALRRSEESLQQSERRFRNYFEQGLIGMAMTALDASWLEVNERLCELLGYSREELSQKTWKELTYFEDLAKDIEQFQRLLAGEIESYTLDKRFVRKDGNIVYTTILIRAFRKDDETIDHIVALIEDITARKQAEEALRSSEERLRLAIAATNDAIWDCNLLDGTVSWNDNYATSFGRPPETSGSWQWWIDHIHPEDRNRVSFSLKEAVQGSKRVWTDEYRFQRTDGVWANIFDRAYIARDESGKARRVVGAMLDITERKLAQEALRASEERYALAVRGAGVGIWDWDVRTGKLYFSPRWKMLFGYGEKDIGDSVEDWARLLHPDEKDWMLKFLNDFLTGTSPTVTVEYRLRHKDGSYRWIVAHCLVVRDRQGKACRLVGSHGDITDRKRAEEALERERQSLWRMLQASDHERQVISYDIHDGLAQYLGGAIMQFQAHEALHENSPNEAKKAHETAVELVRQAYSESRRLISEVRPPIIDENGIELAISHLVFEQRRHGGPKIELHSSVQFGRLPSILENAIYRIAQEALMNACKHSKSKKVKVTMTQEGQEVRLGVQDWGIGFDPESVEKGHFGLEGIRQRVRLLGGRLTIESKPGTGTLVQVVVPIVERKEG